MIVSRLHEQILASGLPTRSAQTMHQLIKAARYNYRVLVVQCNNRVRFYFIFLIR